MADPQVGLVHQVRYPLVDSTHHLFHSPSLIGVQLPYVDTVDSFPGYLDKVKVIKCIYGYNDRNVLLD